MISREELQQLQSKSKPTAPEAPRKAEQPKQVEQPVEANDLQQVMAEGLEKIAKSNDQGIAESIDRLSAQINSMKQADMLPVLSRMIEILKRMDNKARTYKFVIDRDNRGHISEIIAEPYESS